MRKRGRGGPSYRNQPRFPITVPRGSFRSFSGRRSPYLNRKWNNAAPQPYNLTDRQKWDIFCTNGRQKFHKNCILLCDVSYGYVKETFWKESHSHLRGGHAEVKALQRITSKERDFHSSTRWVRMYLSFSPCANCADRILQFSWERPQCKITVAFSCLFKHMEEIHQDGLRRLNAENSITVKVFTRNDWERLAEATDINFVMSAPRRDHFDAKWRDILKEILCEESEYVEEDEYTIYKPPSRLEPAGKKTNITVPSGINKNIVEVNTPVRPHSLNDTRIQIPQNVVPIPSSTLPAVEETRISVRNKTVIDINRPEGPPSVSNDTTIEIPQTNESVQEELDQRRRKKKRIIIIGTSLTILIIIAIILVLIFCVF